MRFRLLKIVCALFWMLPGVALAQSEVSPAQQAVNNAAFAAAADLHAHAVSDCNFTQKTITVPAFAFTPQAQAVVAVTWEFTDSVEWSGACVGGKRDGAGVLTLKTYFLIYPGQSFTNIERSEGRLIRGLKRGSWCLVGTSGSRSCRIEASGGASAGFTQTSDGRWTTGNGAATAYVAAADFEAESQRVIAESIAGRPTTVTLQMASAALGGLVRGDSLPYRPVSGALGLRSKPVAIILSDHTIAELARFKASRQALLNRFAAKPVRGKFGPEFEDLLRRLTNSSDPQQLLTSLSSGMRRGVGSVVPAEDLSVLRTGQADYAVIVDWSFVDRLAMTEAQFDKLPQCSEFGADPNQCPYLFKTSTTIMVVAPNMTVVKQAALLDQFMIGKGSEWNPNEMIAREVRFFEMRWDPNGESGVGYSMFFALNPLG